MRYRLLLHGMILVLSQPTLFLGQTGLPGPLNTTFSCPGLPATLMSGHPQTVPLPVTSAAPDAPLTSLAIRISTNNDLLSGTNDDVWLDVGPKAWKIGNDFDRGTTKTIVIDLTSQDQGIDIPSVVPLLVRDISELRLEKKGLCGLTDAPDSVASALLPPLPTPASMIAELKQQVTYAQYGLEQQQSLVAIQQKLLDQQVQVLLSSQQILSNAESELANIPGQIANLENQITTIQKQILQAPPQITQRACSEVKTAGRVILGVLTGGASELVCRTVQVVNPVWQGLTSTAASLVASKNNLSAELQSAGVRKTAAIQQIAAATAAKAAIEAEKIKDEAQYTVAHTTLDQAQNALAEAEALAAKLPFPNVSLPAPGQWKVQHVTLVVNGHDFANFDVGETLKQRHAEWSRQIGATIPEEHFVYGLRVNVNKPSTVADERLARVSTIFKLSDISGWKPGPVGSARAVGVLKNQPSPGDDGYVSLDLQLERVEVNNQAFVLDSNSGIGYNRFIRVEYKNRQANGTQDTRYKGWNVGTRLVVEAPVFWDTDRNGFYELHPDNPAQVNTLQPGESGATPTVMLWWKRLTQ